MVSLQNDIIFELQGAGLEVQSRELRAAQERGTEASEEGDRTQLQLGCTVRR